MKSTNATIGSSQAAAPSSQGRRSPGSSRRSKARRGIATSEAALILPIVLLLTFGTIEITSLIFLKESATIAAHEGARVAIRKQASSNDAKLRVQAVLSQRGVTYNSGSFFAISANPATANELDPIKVTVNLPANGNTLLSGAAWTWIGGKTVSGTCTMLKEYKKD